MNESNPQRFRKIYAGACGFAFGICMLFAVAGDFLLSEVFRVELPAMQIFGGLIIFGVAYAYIVSGPEGVKLFRGEITEIAQQIALPLMIGPGVIWMCVRIGRFYDLPSATLIVMTVIAINALFVLIYHAFFKRAKGPIELAMIKYFAMAMRLNALLIGAVSVQMILAGLHEYINARDWAV